jgi:hypothetical protein
VASRQDRQNRTIGRRRRLRLASAVLALACVSGAVTLDGSRHEAGAAPPVVGFRTGAIDQPSTRFSRSKLTRDAISWAGGPTTASTGETVNVLVSATLPADAGTPQTWADFIAGLEHGPELASLTAYIATFDEMGQVCGAQALGCYGSDQLIAIGEPAYGVTPQEVVRHEYGHHVAAHRMNPPWAAVDWGPKYWATTMNVCRRAADRTAYPGDEGANYELNPGEAWAETYRALQERRAGATSFAWDIIDGSFYPTDAGFQAAERDIDQPWGGPHTVVYKKSFARRGKRVWTIPLRTPLDGNLELTATFPRGALDGVELLDSDRKTVLGDGLWASSRTKHLMATVCGERMLFLRVTQKGAFGRVAVSATLP